MIGDKAISVIKEQIGKYDLLESTERFSKLGIECGEARDELKQILEYILSHKKDIFNDGKCFECNDIGLIVIEGKKYTCPSCNS